MVSRLNLAKPATPALPAVQAVQAVQAVRPAVDFLDPLMRHAALQAKGIGLCSFLITLAALQRGLKVTFHYERASFDPRFAAAKMQGHRGEVFSLSDGRNTHTFSRTQGSKTSPAANAIAEDKHQTKRALAKAQVRTPDGIVVERSQATLVSKFLARVPGRRYVVKPLNGSLASGVHADLAAQDVLGVVQGMAATRLLVEAYVVGTELRATVVGSRCVAVSQRVLPSVVGDGRASLHELLVQVNQARAQNPFSGAIAFTDEVKAFLARQGLTPDSVPAAGARVLLLNTSYGVGHSDVTDTIGDAVKLQAVKAAQAVGLPNCGLDMIVTEAGETVVLELNQRAYIGMHSFPTEGPGQGNAVAEALVDLYFPGSANHPAHPTLVYDFAAVRAVLDSAQVAELSLPVVGPDWTVARFTQSGPVASALVELWRTLAKTTGVYTVAAPLPGGDVACCFYGAPARIGSFNDELPPKMKSPLAAQS
jgi:D-alanine-D-alanine ligase-like ATP-grasp enzyme